MLILVYAIFHVLLLLAVIALGIVGWVTMGLIVEERRDQRTAARKRRKTDDRL